MAAVHQFRPVVRFDFLLWLFLLTLCLVLPSQCRYTTYKDVEVRCLPSCGNDHRGFQGFIGENLTIMFLFPTNFTSLTVTYNKSNVFTIPGLPGYFVDDGRVQDKRFQIPRTLTVNGKMRSITLMIRKLKAEDNGRLFTYLYQKEKNQRMRPPVYMKATILTVKERLVAAEVDAGIDWILIAVIILFIILLILACCLLLCCLRCWEKRKKKKQMQIVGVPTHYPPPQAYAVPVHGKGGWEAKSQNADVVQSSSPWVINSPGNLGINSHSTSPGKLHEMPNDNSVGDSGSNSRGNSRGNTPGHSRGSSQNGELVPGKGILNSDPGGLNGNGNKRVSFREDFSPFASNDQDGVTTLEFDDSEAHSSPEIHYSKVHPATDSDDSQSPPKVDEKTQIGDTPSPKRSAKGILPPLPPRRGASLHGPKDVDKGIEDGYPGHTNHQGGAEKHPEDVESGDDTNAKSKWDPLRTLGKVKWNPEHLGKIDSGASDSTHSADYPEEPLKKATSPSIKKSSAPKIGIPLFGKKHHEDKGNDSFDSNQGDAFVDPPTQTAVRDAEPENKKRKASPSPRQQRGKDAGRKQDHSQPKPTRKKIRYGDDVDPDNQTVERTPLLANSKFPFTDSKKKRKKDDPNDNALYPPAVSDDDANYSKPNKSPKLKRQRGRGGIGELEHPEGQESDPLLQDPNRNEDAAEYYPTNTGKSHTPGKQKKSNKEGLSFKDIFPFSSGKDKMNRTESSEESPLQHDSSGREGDKETPSSGRNRDPPNTEFPGRNSKNVESKDDLPNSSQESELESEETPSSDDPTNNSISPHRGADNGVREQHGRPVKSPSSTRNLPSSEGKQGDLKRSQARTPSHIWDSVQQDEDDDTEGPYGSDNNPNLKSGPGRPDSQRSKHGDLASEESTSSSDQHESEKPVPGYHPETPHSRDNDRKSENRNPSIPESEKKNKFSFFGGKGDKHPHDSPFGDWVDDQPPIPDIFNTGNIPEDIWNMEATKNSENKTPHRDGSLRNPDESGKSLKKPKHRDDDGHDAVTGRSPDGDRSFGKPSKSGQSPREPKRRNDEGPNDSTGWSPDRDGMRVNPGKSGPSPREPKDMNDEAPDDSTDRRPDRDWSFKNPGKSGKSPREPRNINHEGPGESIGRSPGRDMAFRNPNKPDAAPREPKYRNDEGPNNSTGRSPDRNGSFRNPNKSDAAPREPKHWNDDDRYDSTGRSPVRDGSFRNPNKSPREPKHRNDDDPYDYTGRSPDRNGSFRNPNKSDASPREPKHRNDDDRYDSTGRSPDRNGSLRNPNKSDAAPREPKHRNDDDRYDSTGRSPDRDGSFRNPNKSPRERKHRNDEGHNDSTGRSPDRDGSFRKPNKSDASPRRPKHRGDDDPYDSADRNPDRDGSIEYPNKSGKSPMDQKHRNNDTQNDVAGSPGNTDNPYIRKSKDENPTKSGSEKKSKFPFFGGKGREDRYPHDSPSGDRVDQPPVRDRRNNDSLPDDIWNMDPPEVQNPQRDGSIRNPRKTNQSPRESNHRNIDAQSDRTGRSPERNGPFRNPVKFGDSPRKPTQQSSEPHNSMGRSPPGGGSFRSPGSPGEQRHMDPEPQNDNTGRRPHRDNSFRNPESPRDPHHRKTKMQEDSSDEMTKEDEFSPNRSKSEEPPRTPKHRNTDSGEDSIGKNPLRNGPFKDRSKSEESPRTPKKNPYTTGKHQDTGGAVSYPKKGEASPRTPKDKKKFFKSVIPKKGKSTDDLEDLPPGSSVHDIPSPEILPPRLDTSDSYPNARDSDAKRYLPGKRQQPSKKGLSLKNVLPSFNNGKEKTNLDEHRDDRPLESDSSSALEDVPTSNLDLAPTLSVLDTEQSDYTDDPQQNRDFKHDKSEQKYPRSTTSSESDNGKPRRWELLRERFSTSPKPAKKYIGEEESTDPELESPYVSIVPRGKQRIPARLRKKSSSFVNLLGSISNLPYPTKNESVHRM